MWVYVNKLTISVKLTSFVLCIIDTCEVQGIKIMHFQNVDNNEYVYLQIEVGKFGNKNGPLNVVNRNVIKKKYCLFHFKLKGTCDYGST